VRRRSEALCDPLAADDYGIQTIPEVSPPKWHLAHTSWFFETFLLRPHLAGYRDFHPQYARLFNSYYETVGRYHPRAQRGWLSRPTVTEIYRYRAHVDECMTALLDDETHPARAEIDARLLLGLHHEQQHQELLLMDIKHVFASNPLHPVYRAPDAPGPGVAPADGWIDYAGGRQMLGHNGADFAFDNELPRHPVITPDFRLARRPVSNADYLGFIEAGGYRRAEYWLSDGWRSVQEQGWQAPLYWEADDGQWSIATLAGLQPLDPAAPVCHVSFFEADAYARFRRARLPTEAEWEQAAQGHPVRGNFYESGCLQPQADAGSEAPAQLFGDVWEWTRSAYLPYPGYRAPAGALGEYNGKFMSGQMVLRGGSCLTPADHVRASYRNFYHPADRWVCAGIRLACDA
jgi:ergothioneine biosynthesis protein EgtB